MHVLQFSSTYKTNLKKKRLSFLCLISQLVLSLGEDRRIFYWSENPAGAVKMKVM